MPKSQLLNLIEKRDNIVSELRSLNVRKSLSTSQSALLDLQISFLEKESEQLFKEIKRLYSKRTKNPTLICQKCGIEASKEQVRLGKCCKLAKEWKKKCGREKVKSSDLPDYDELRRKRDVFDSPLFVNGGSFGLGKSRKH